jgi:hypothetical protein
MSAFTINKVACRVYGTLFVLLGATVLLFGGILIFGSVFPDRVPDWKSLPGFDTWLQIARASASKPGTFWPLGVASLVFAVIPIAIGVYACLRYVWAMIIGTLLWVVFCFPGPLLFFPRQRSGYRAFEIIITVVFVLLTIVVVAWRPRPAAPRPSPHQAQ